MRTAGSLALAFVVAFVACGGSTTLPTASLPPPQTVVTATSGAPTVTPTVAPTSTVASSPILSIALIDVRTGERFTLGGFRGKTVIVQGMAVW